MSRPVLRRRKLHGWAGTKSTYRAMKGRCLDPRNTGWSRYGGRGITICPEWLGDGGWQRFRAFMGPRPAGHTIDRIDNSRGYEPGNVRWATASVQNTNVTAETRAARADRCRRWRRDRSARLGLAMLAKYGRVLGFSDTHRLMCGIRDELEATFGPPAPMPVPRERMCIEEAFLACDFSEESFHFEGLERFTEQVRGPKYSLQQLTGRLAA